MWQLQDAKRTLGRKTSWKAQLTTHKEIFAKGKEFFCYEEMSQYKYLELSHFELDANFEK